MHKRISFILFSLNSIYLLMSTLLACKRFTSHAIVGKKVWLVTYLGEKGCKIVRGRQNCKSESEYNFTTKEHF